jgi:hypothetical protein
VGGGGAPAGSYPAPRLLLGGGGGGGEQVLQVASHLHRSANTGNNIELNLKYDVNLGKDISKKNTSSHFIEMREKK